MSQNPEEINSNVLENEPSHSENKGICSSGTQENNLSILVDILSLFFGFIPPLIVYLFIKDQPFLREQTRLVLNASIIYTILFVISAALNATVILMIIGVPLGLFVAVLAIFSLIKAAIENSNGRIYHLPLIPNIIK